MADGAQAWLPLRHEIVADLFAGGGGASQGIRQALGRCPDIAVNHNADAIFVHETNHPTTTHFLTDVFMINPKTVTSGQPVGLAWFSPDCKHFSKAKGGKPVSKKIRGLAWDAVRWARITRPRVIILENVEEFKDWGPLIEVEPGKWMPDPDRKGETFKRWVCDLRREGYVVEWRELRACDYGAPTIRKRLFVIARRDGRPIVWPVPTHGKTSGLIPFRTAADCIDWSIHVPSIFKRKRALKPATNRRIATGTVRHVIDCPDPFIVPLTHHGDRRSHSLDESMPTVTGANRGELALVQPFAINTRNGERRGQEPRTRSLDEPYFTPTALGSQGALVAPVVVGLAHGTHTERPGGRSHGVDEPIRTIHAGGGNHALVAAHIAQHNSDRRGRPRAGRPITEPLSTLTSVPKQQQLVAAFLAQHNTGMVGHDLRNPMSTIVGKGCTQAPVIVKLKGTAKGGQSVRDPLHTVQAGGTHYALAELELADFVDQMTPDEVAAGHRVYAFLVKYYTSGSGKTGASLKKPLPTVRTRDGFALVVVKVGGVLRPIIDIGMRMLQPHELFAAQGFPRDYQIAPMRNGKPLTKTAQIRLCGNSVCPPVAEALVRANFRHEAKYEAKAA